ncbi:uncharacterized protein LOC119296313 [Triticum dicoccoides]|uniref:uncharacterized protein LOC119296313 n=1 Tax=Triticum dicoccoides TaxID=85692 RepID=UPI00188E3904|nr:uncharacterized protein LOC119296313 [Triticum dicoccoides]
MRFLCWGRRSTRLRPCGCGRSRRRHRQSETASPAYPRDVAAPRRLPTRRCRSRRAFAHVVAAAPQDTTGTTRPPPPAASLAYQRDAATPHARLSSAGCVPLRGRCTRRGIWMRWLPRSTLSHKRLDEDTEISPDIEVKDNLPLPATPHTADCPDNSSPRKSRPRPQAEHPSIPSDSTRTRRSFHGRKWRYVECILAKLSCYLHQ